MLSDFDSSARSILHALHFIFAKCWDHFESPCQGCLRQSFESCYELIFYSIFGKANSPLCFYLFIDEFEDYSWVQMENAQVFDLR